VTANVGDAPKAGPGLVAVVLAFVVITIVAGGAGAAYRMVFARPAVAAGAQPPAPSKSVAAPATDKLRSLAPVITNLADTPNVWLRLEVAVVFDASMKDLEVDAMARDIGDDVMAYARTLSLAQIQGSSGLYHLREDLGERAQIRSAGKVREVMIQSLVVQ
jgi:flagellar FliL protein